MNEKVTIINRNEIEVQGATRVIASTAKEAVVEIEGGVMTITGANLEVTKLDLDNKEVKFSGIISNVKFSERREKVGLIKRIFK